jgi:carbamoyltransferase
MLTHLVDVKPDGSLAMDMSYFNYCQGLTMTNDRFASLFGGPARDPESAITQREMDMAASIQKVTEDVVLKMARHAKELTGSRYLCLAGGVALNCVANGKLLRERIFDDVFVTPASGDAGGALGAALFVQHQLLDKPRAHVAADVRRRTADAPASMDNPPAHVVGYRDSLKGSLLGPKFSNEEIRAFLDGQRVRYTFHDSEPELLEAVAQEMASEKVIGWFHGRMEFGPRALGARSIIGDPRSPAMQSQMNLRIKFRESFRPFAPCVLLEDVDKYFDHDRESPYMLMVAEVRKEHWLPPTEEQQRLMRDPDLRKRVNVPRSTLPAITHVDMSARIQTVDEERHGRYWRLMKEFKRQTGCGVIINTSFNIRGEPIVCTPEGAYRCFMASDMDVLVLENCVLRRTEQPPPDESARKQYIESFKLD